MCLLDIVQKYNEYIFEKVYNKPYDSEIDKFIILWANKLKDSLLIHRISTTDILFDYNREVIINNHRYMMILGYYNSTINKNIYWR